MTATLRVRFPPPKITPRRGVGSAKSRPRANNVFISDHQIVGWVELNPPESFSAPDGNPGMTGIAAGPRGFPFRRPSVDIARYVARWPT